MSSGAVSGGASGCGAGAAAGRGTTWTGAEERVWTGAETAAVSSPVVTVPPRLPALAAGVHGAARISASAVHSAVGDLVAFQDVSASLHSIVNTVVETEWQRRHDAMARAVAAARDQVQCVLVYALSLHSLTAFTPFAGPKHDAEASCYVPQRRKNGRRSK